MFASFSVWGFTIVFLIRYCSQKVQFESWQTVCIGEKRAGLYMSHCPHRPISSRRALDALVARFYLHMAACKRIRSNLGTLVHFTSSMGMFCMSSYYLLTEEPYISIVFQACPLSQQFLEKRCSMESLKGYAFIIDSAWCCVMLMFR